MTGHRAPDTATADTRPAPELLTPDEVAAELRVTTKTLRNWRSLDSGRPPHEWRGPAYVMRGPRRALYRRDAVDAYLARLTR